MTKDRDLKRRIRARMEKTGESYTTARTHVLRQRPVPGPDLPDDYPALVPQTDETLRKKTGRDWPEWVRELDAMGAMEMSHRDVAARVAEITGLGWWAQTITVGYERIRGLRDVGQRRGGGYEANRSRTVKAPLAAAFDAFIDEGSRRRWLDTDLHVRGATPGKSVRIDWADGTNVIVTFDGGKPGKTVVAVTHGKLPSKESQEAMKAFWGDRLTALKELLEG